MPASDQFDVMLRKAIAGDSDAGSSLFQEYIPRLIGLARNHLSDRIKSKLDSDDVAQSVFRTFLRNAKQGKFELPSERALWALLAAITINKCRRARRKYQAGKRAADRETRTDDDSLLPSREPG